MGEHLFEDLEISLALDFFRIPPNQGLCLTGYVIALSRQKNINGCRKRGRHIGSRNTT
jgi:hypothetical protein